MTQIATNQNGTARKPENSDTRRSETIRSEDMEQPAYRVPYGRQRYCPDEAVTRETTA